MCTGVKVDSLLLSNMEHIIGAALPYQETGDTQDRAFAATVLSGGVLAKHVTGTHCMTDGHTLDAQNKKLVAV